ncbi:MAG TPA: hypothetical protein DEG69_09085, partial [Flavobacteriaceae bacterium]|nr:hypothetical protein [Flavobacteriaceae bacterium]
LAEGDYSVKFNMDGTVIEMTRYENQYSSDVLTSDLTTRVQSKASQQWGKMNKVVFYIPSTGGDFRGKLDNVSLKDMTNYFIPSSSESWIFGGFDQTVENYISWSNTNKNIIFDNAPSSAFLMQSIPEQRIQKRKFFNGASVN